jgi:hypothetical protein
MIGKTPQQAFKNLHNMPFLMDTYNFQRGARDQRCLVYSTVDFDIPHLEKLLELRRYDMRRLEQDIISHKLALADSMVQGELSFGNESSREYVAMLSEELDAFQVLQETIEDLVNRIDLDKGLAELRHRREERRSGF